MDPFIRSDPEHLYLELVDRNFKMKPGVEGWPENVMGPAILLGL